MYWHWAALDLAVRFILLFIVRESAQFWVRWATQAQPGAAAVVVDNGRRSSNSSRSSALDIRCHAEHSQGGGQGTVPSPTRGTRRGKRNRELKVTCAGRSVSVAGARRDPFTELFFKMQCMRKERHTKVLLVLDQVDLGIKNCCTGNCASLNRSCDSSCNPVFIYKMTIEVCPKSWARGCHRLLLEPPLTSEVFGLQRSSSLSLQMPLVSPKQASATYQTGSTISSTAPAFGWAPASRDHGSNSVTWTWELSRCADGSKLEFKKFRRGSRPQFRIQPSYMQIHPGSFQAKASWELQSNEELQEHQLEWDMKLILHTAFVQKKRYLPFYSVTVGPTVRFEKLLNFSQAIR